MSNTPTVGDDSQPLPFTKHEIRMVHVAANVVAKIQAGARASEAIEAALTTGHYVAIPMRDEHGAIDLRVEEGWRIPVAEQGSFRGIVRYMRLEDTTGLTPDVIVGRAAAMQMRMGQTGR